RSGRRASAVLLGAPKDIVDQAALLRARGIEVVGALCAEPVRQIEGVEILAFGEIATLLDALQLLKSDPGFLVLASPLSCAHARGGLDRAVEEGRRGAAGRATAPPRPLSLSDLIGAPLRGIDLESVRRLVAGKRILVTGGAGSIGGELSRRIAGLRPADL